METKKNHNIPEGGYCTFKVNAEAGVARVTINESRVGIELPEKFETEAVYTVPDGVEEFLIFNPEERTLQVEITFSGASLLSSGSVAIGAILTYLSF